MVEMILYLLYLSPLHFSAIIVMKTYTLKEAANFLKIHPDTLRERVLGGIIPGAKIGKAWVFIEKDLAQYIRKNYRQAVDPSSNNTELYKSNVVLSDEATHRQPQIPSKVNKLYYELLGLPIPKKVRR